MSNRMHDHRLETAVSTPAAVAGPARRAPSGAPDRSRLHGTGRAAGLVLLAATLGLLLFLGGVLFRGASDLTEEARAIDLGSDACRTTRCAIEMADVDPRLREPLPREWRWESKALDLDHMYRE